MIRIRLRGRAKFNFARPLTNLFFLLLLLAEFGVSGVVKPWKSHGRLQVSLNGHFLQHEDGTVFFWLGDTAWALHQNLSRSDVIRYLDNASAAGFNVVQLMSVNPWALKDWKDYYGDRPYLDNSAVKLNPPFWRHLGWVIDQAAVRGLYVLLVYGSPGRTDNHGAVTHTPREAYGYGHALGMMFKNKPNLIWSSGMLQLDSSHSGLSISFRRSVWSYVRSLPDLAVGCSRT